MRNNINVLHESDSSGAERFESIKGKKVGKLYGL